MSHVPYKRGREEISIIILQTKVHMCSERRDMWPCPREPASLESSLNLSMLQIAPVCVKVTGVTVEKRKVLRHSASARCAGAGGPVQASILSSQVAESEDKFRASCIVRSCLNFNKKREALREHTFEK